jgi:hypothetical protein
LPVAHIVGVDEEHVEPFASFETHWPPLQYSLLLAQSASLPHVVLQAVVPQT